ncbi:M14 family zinc carboxypeptidase [Pseudobacteriovorax antillogorgiicola]|uniref:Zinc carboxypeptidase n=1 Tax=Pseudobacteriovorax antillogorgiicola TaxID=1513793 RepID=A0A1Y6B4U4_9BACT|nr:M14 family zinc carboxypeptidase [Pseudobacteriovorax antillogorgiicola]TCS59507.1 zinc carboxypeptidase [Pseudobacteriovorax antillogorgiicola]SME87892.1 Zinc carboxypeptidase [Pseudobacteriovorax antillogorgiicola]
MNRLLAFTLLILPIASALSQTRVTIKQSTVSELTGKQSKSVQGRNIDVFTAKIPGNERTPYRFFLQAGLHGNESLTTDFVHWLIGRLRSGVSPLSKLPAGSEIDLIPEANPDSSKRYRNNANNVNLNRNFSILWGVSKEPMGDKPFSEPETQAIKRLFGKRKYISAIDIHGYLNWVILPSDIGKSVKQSPLNYDRWSSAAETHSEELPGYFLKKAGELGDGGAFEDWAYWDQNVYALCLEMRYPFRHFRYRHHQNFDSFASYETYIFKMFETSIKLQPNPLQYAFDVIPSDPWSNVSPTEIPAH